MNGNEKEEIQRDCFEHWDLWRLGESCKAAPRFGKNGKELVLEAVDKIDNDFEFDLPPTQTTPQKPFKRPKHAETTQKVHVVPVPNLSCTEG